MPAQPHVDLAAVAARLRARRDELLRLTAEHEDESDPVELDQARVGRLSRMDALQSQALAAEVERRREVELERIDMALERIEQGEYGYCVACGEPIVREAAGARPGDAGVHQLRRALRLSFGRSCAVPNGSSPATISRWTAT